MKLKAALLAAVFAAGILASLALAKPPKHGDPVSTSTSTTETTSTNPKPKCHQIELKGTAVSGSVTFTVTKENKQGNLVGTQVTLSVPANAKVKAKACTTPGSNVLTLRNLHVNVSPATP